MALNSMGLLTTRITGRDINQLFALPTPITTDLQVRQLETVINSTPGTSATVYTCKGLPTATYISNLASLDCRTRRDWHSRAMSQAWRVNWRSSALPPNNLLPGTIATERIQELGDTANALVAKAPPGRAGQPDEFGAACAFLCSRQAAYAAAQNILFDGGLRSFAV
jgi:hypothetical protein